MEPISTIPGTRSADNFDYWEIPVVLGYQVDDRFALELTNLFSPENQFNTGLANYVIGLAYYDIPVPYVDLQLFGGVGYQYVEDDFNGTDWRLGATVTVKGVDFTVAYTDTDYRARECGNNQCNAKVLVHRRHGVLTGRRIASPARRGREGAEIVSAGS